MWTDSSPKRGRELLRQIERLRQIVLGVAFPRAPAAGRSLVIAFRNAEERGAFVPPQFTAYSWAGQGGILQPVIVIVADADREDPRILAHELTHIISYAVIAAQPRWFAEGLAGFFETVKLDEDQRVVEVGLPLDFMLSRIRDTGPTPMATVFACTMPACMDDRYYATAWLLFSYLVNVHPAEFLRYQARLAAVSPEEHSGVWKEIFPALTPETLDRVVREWFNHSTHKVWKFEVTLKDSPITERPIGDAEVHVTRGLLRYYFDRTASVEPPEIATALRVDPTNLVAHLVRASWARAANPDDARRVATTHSGDWRAWWMLGFAVKRGEEADRARLKVCELAPNPQQFARGMCPAATVPSQ